MLGRSFAKITFYGVAIVIFLWTATLTFSFVRNTLPGVHWIVPLFSLVVFDGGLIAWLIVFLDFAEGSFQRTIAIMACVFDLIGVGLMTTAEIFLGGQTLVAAPESLGDLALWGIGIWTISNVAAVIGFHLFDPAARQRMALQSQRDKIFDQALTKLNEQVDNQADKLAATLAGRNFSALLQELSVDRNGDGVPDAFQRNGNDRDYNRQSSGGPVNRPQPLTPENEQRPYINGVERRRVEVAFPLDNDVNLYRPVEPQRQEQRPQPPQGNGVNHDGNMISGAVTGDEEDGNDGPFLAGR